MATQSDLLQHTNSQHANERTYACEYCDRIYKDRNGLFHCRNRHTKVFGCPVCDFRTSRKDGVTAHMRRKHPDSAGLEVLTILLNQDPAMQPPAMADLNYPLPPAGVAHLTPPPQYDAFVPAPPQFPLNAPMPIPRYWVTYQWVPVVLVTWSDRLHLY